MGYTPKHLQTSREGIDDIVATLAKAALLVMVWSIAILTFGYLLPWAVAVSRRKSNHWGILLVNFLLGWTLIGWVVALVMSCTERVK